MNAQQLAQFKKGDRITLGVLLPIAPNDEIEWEAIAVGTGTRQTKKGNEQFPWVEFRLTWLGVEVGRLLGTAEDGSIRWESRA